MSGLYAVQYCISAANDAVASPPTDTGPKIGDRVRLVSEAPLRKDEMDLQGKTGEIIECTEGKRVTVRFANGRLLMGRDVALFERA